MSEYRYYECQAIDGPLGEVDREALRTLPTRTRIAATSLSNHYEWGDFKGDLRRLMERLHLYLANWGTRRLMIRLPKRLVDLRALAEEDDAMTTFSDHRNALWLRHERKTRFIERLAELDRTG